MPRKRMTKEAKIRRALDAGVPMDEIVYRYGTTTSYVYFVRRKYTAPRPVQAEPSLVQEHSVGPLPPAPRVEPVPESYFASGLVSLQPEPPQPTAGISSIPLGAGEVRGIEGPPKPTLWQRFKLWAWGRA